VSGLEDKQAKRETKAGGTRKTEGRRREEEGRAAEETWADSRQERCVQIRIRVIWIRS